MKNGWILVLFLMASLWGAAQERDGLWASKVFILTDWDEIFPGEVMDITLSAFLDEEGNVPEKGFRIIVGAVHGEILNGEHSHIPKGKSFLISDPVIVKYCAPAAGSADTDKIIVYSDHTLPEEIYGKTLEEGDMPITEIIGEKILKIVSGDFARLIFYEYSRSKEHTLEINVTLGVRFRSMGGAGAMIPHEVHRVTVLECSGYVDTRDGKRYNLTAAVPFTPESVIMLYRDLTSGKIDSVVFPQYGLKLSWSGPDGYVPPKTIVMGPVTEWDNEAAQKKLKAEAKDIQSSMKDGKMDMSRIMKIQGMIKDASAHPDYKVKTHFTKNYVAGEGEVEHIEADWQSKKRFTWEIHLN